MALNSHNLNVMLMRLIGKQLPELAAAMSEYPQYVTIKEIWVMDPDVFVIEPVEKFNITTGLPGCESHWLLLAHIDTQILFCWKED